MTHKPYQSTGTWRGVASSLALLALGGLAACAGSPPATPQDTAGVTDAGLARWELVRWQTAEGAERTLPAGEPVFLLFSNGVDAEQGAVSGNTGCNQVRGGYAKTASGIRFTQMISTRRACEPERMAIESGLQAALSAPLERVAAQPSEAAPGGRQVMWKTSAGELLQFQEREPARRK